MFGGEGVEGCCIADLGMDAAKATGIIQESYVSHNHTVTHTYTHIHTPTISISHHCLPRRSLQAVYLCS